MRLVVTGGRYFEDAIAVERALEAVHRKHGIEVLIQGGATGADRLCAEWAWYKEIPVTTFEANWPEFGKRAGPLRNQQMLDEGKPDAAVAFPGGGGTADMVRRIKLAGIPIWEVTPASPSSAR